MVTTLFNRRGFLKRVFAASIAAALGLRMSTSAAPAPPNKPPTTQRRAHAVSLSYHVSAVAGEEDVGVIEASVKKLKGVTAVDVNVKSAYVQVGFDSHAVSYHQVAQAITDAGASAKKVYDPRLKIRVSEYAEGSNAAKVDVIFSGKRLNQHVHIEVLDKSKGEFMVHFLPLELDPAESGPQGFNGGHLNHPIHDPVPRGLGLTFIYVSEKA